MTTRDINSMPLGRQFTLLAHLYKIELLELSRLAGRTFMEVAVVAGSMVYDVAYYTKHRHVPRHR